MRLPPAQFTVRWLIVVVACLAFFLAFVVAPMYRLSRYSRVRRQMYDLIYSLQYPVPQGTSPSVWECTWGWTVTAYANICFSEEHVPIEEMYRLREDLLSKLQGSTSPDLLVWIWDR